MPSRAPLYERVSMFYEYRGLSRRITYQSLAQLPIASNLIMNEDVINSVPGSTWLDEGGGIGNLRPTASPATSQGP